jgi:exosortase/archaeosortase family protein
MGNAVLQLTEPQKFGLRFFSTLVGASVLTWAVDLPNRLGAAQRFLAGTAGVLARLVGSDSSVIRDQIHIASLTLDINYECTGAYVLIVLFTFLLAYPAPWKARLSGASVGLVALTAVNIFRISVLIRVAELRPDLFAYFHEYVWQGVFLVLVIAYAMTWVERLQ